VLKADQTVSGVISEKDFLKKMNSETVPSLMHMILRCVDTKGCMAVGLKALNAVDIMSFPCVTVKPQTPVMKIANLMDQKNINRVPVINDRFELVGIITRSDIVQTMC
jgi:CBS domain-containing membrane protein